MARTYICRRDGQTGNILGLTREDFIFTASCGDSIQFQIEGGSYFASEATILTIRENESQESCHQGSLISGHWVSTITFNVSGSIKLNLTLNDRNSAIEYIIINPLLTLSNIQYPTESLCIQTVLSRSLGEISK